MTSELFNNWCNYSLAPIPIVPLTQRNFHLWCFSLISLACFVFNPCSSPFLPFVIIWVWHKCVMNQVEIQLVLGLANPNHTLSESGLYTRFWKGALYCKYVKCCMEIYHLIELSNSLPMAACKQNMKSLVWIWTITQCNWFIVHKINNWKSRFAASIVRDVSLKSFCKLCLRQCLHDSVHVRVWCSKLVFYLRALRVKLSCL